MSTPISSLSAPERAWQWWQAAWALFLQSPIIFMFLGFCYFAFCLLIFLLTREGGWIFALLLYSFGQPFFRAFLFRYIRAVHQPEERAPFRLSATQKKSLLWQILWRARYQLPGLWRFSLHLNIYCRLSAGQAKTLIRMGIIGFAVFLLSVALDLLLRQAGGIHAGAVLLLSLLWWMAFWCAPQLAVWGHHSAAKSLLFSFLTAWFNWRPVFYAMLLFAAFTLFAMTAGTFVIMLVMPVLQGWLFMALLCIFCLPIVVMMYFCLIYRMYLDFFPFPAHVSEHV
ncbi:MAG: hypothetical protein FWH15_08300 [Betaproteobacteria bacterium]|nr:hypothetical protein [Betaproteobacteria bacterium]